MSKWSHKKSTASIFVIHTYMHTCTRQEGSDNDGTGRDDEKLSRGEVQVSRLKRQTNDERLNSEEAKAKGHITA